jgi:hypothetical protein
VGFRKDAAIMAASEVLSLTMMNTGSGSS